MSRQTLREPLAMAYWNVRSAIDIRRSLWTEQTADFESKEMTPFEYDPRKPISKAEREARKAFRQVDADKAMTEYEIAKKAFSDNYARLKAERLAREAAETPDAAPKKGKTRVKAGER